MEPEPCRRSRSSSRSRSRSSSSGSSDRGSSTSSDAERKQHRKRRKERRETEQLDKKKKRKEEKRAKEKRAKEKREKKKRRKEEKRKHRREKHKREEAQPELPPMVYAGVATPALPQIQTGNGPEQRETPRRALGAQRPEEAAAEFERSQRVHRVYDESLGVTRLVRESGEVLESCVSLQEQRRLMAAKAMHVQPVSQARALGPPTAAESYTGRDKFPSQHPWFGFK